MTLQGSKQRLVDLLRGLQAQNGGTQTRYRSTARVIIIRCQVQSRPTAFERVWWRREAGAFEVFPRLN